MPSAIQASDKKRAWRIVALCKRRFDKRREQQRKGTASISLLPSYSRRQRSCRCSPPKASGQTAANNARLSRGLHRPALPNQTNFATSSSRRGLLANAAIWRLSSRVRSISVETIHNSESAMAGDVKYFEMGTNGPGALKNNSAYLVYHRLFLLNICDLMSGRNKRVLEVHALVHYGTVFSGG